MYESPRNAGNVGKTPKMHSLVFCLGKSLWLVCHAVIAVQVLSTLVFRPSKTARSVYFGLFVGGFIAQFSVPAAPKSQHQASWGPSGPPISWLTPHMRFQHLSQNLRIEGRIVPSACWGEAPTRVKMSSPCGMDCGEDGDAELTSSASAVLRGRHRQVKVSSDETMTISTSKGLVSGSNVHDDEKKQSAKLKCCCRFVADERRYGLQHTTGWLKCRQSTEATDKA